MLFAPIRFKKENDLNINFSLIKLTLLKISLSCIYKRDRYTKFECIHIERRQEKVLDETSTKIKTI